MPTPNQNPWTQIKQALETARTNFGTEVEWTFTYFRNGIIILFAIMIIGMIAAYALRMANIRWLDWLLSEAMSMAAGVIGLLALGSILVTLF